MTLALPPGSPVRVSAPGGALYGRLLPGPLSGVCRIRLTADHRRGRKGARVYVLAKRTAPYRRGRHASGVRLTGPRWLQWVARRR